MVKCILVLAFSVEPRREAGADALPPLGHDSQPLS